MFAVGVGGVSGTVVVSMEAPLETAFERKNGGRGIGGGGGRVGPGEMMMAVGLHRCCG